MLKNFSAPALNSCRKRRGTARSQMANASSLAAPKMPEHQQAIHSCSFYYFPSARGQRLFQVCLKALNVYLRLSLFPSVAHRARFSRPLIRNLPKGKLWFPGRKDPGYFVPQRVECLFLVLFALIRALQFHAKRFPEDSFGVHRGWIYQLDHLCVTKIQNVENDLVCDENILTTHH